MNNGWRLAMVVLLAGGVLAGCGGDDDDNQLSGSGSASVSGDTEGAEAKGEASVGVSLPGKTNDHGTKTAEGGAIELEQDDFYFGPTFVKATGGATVKVELKNEGSAPHTFTIASPAVDVTVDAGKTASVNVALPAVGPVPFFCRFHQGSGMQGAFIVT